MKKPSPQASKQAWAQYREWVREQLKDWDPADDRGSPTDYIPRHNGVFAEGIENVSKQPVGPYSSDD